MTRETRPENALPSAGTTLEQEGVPGPARRVGPGFIAAYLFLQFGNWLALLTPVVVTIALRVAQVATPEEKATQLGLVLGVGAFASVVATPIWGFISDRTTARIGRRKPWMIIGVLGGGIGLTLMAASGNMLVLGIGWAIAQIGFNANQAALNAVLPDAVPERQRGRVSGFLGMSTPVAILFGSFFTQFTAVNPYLMFLAPWAVTVVGVAIMLAVFNDTPADKKQLSRISWKDLGRTFWVNPRKHPDFAWAFTSRFLFFLGISFLQSYQVYFLLDHLKVSGQQITTYIFISTLITAVATVIVSLAGGWLSDRLSRRKPFVFAAAAIAAVGLVVIGTSTSFGHFLVGVAITSLGSGLYFAIDLALVAAVLPSPDDVAKDMGVFQIANSLPQSLGPAIAPIFLAIGAAGTGNYFAVFIAAGAFAVLGAFAIVPVRGAR